MKIIAQLLAISFSLLFAASAQTHHSFAATFQSDAKITIEGIVTDFSFRNPHILVYLDVTDEDGSVTGWVSEGSAATLMRRAGWAADSINPGDRIRIYGDSTHDGSPMTSIDTADILNAETGAVLAELIPAGGRQNPAAEKAAAMPLELANNMPNLTGAWTSHGITGERPRGIPMERTELGVQMQANFDGANDPQIFCDEPGLVRQIQTPHPYRITQYDDRVVFEYEEYAGRREVYFDGRNALGILSNFGDSVARYEGDTLVVETTNLMANPTSPTGNSLSNAASLVEVYSRTDSDEYGPMVNLTATISDPLHFTEDATFSRVKMSAGEYSFIENNCQQPLRERTAVSPEMNFFLASQGPGDGANLGGLEGADAHCTALAASVGQGHKNWAAYLSTSTGVNARDRIGSGPFYNAKSAHIALDIEDLHAEASQFVKSTVVDEHGQVVNGRGDTPNRHDILTGSDANGMAVISDSDTSCSDWTSNGEGSALVGHFDRQGGGDNPTSWNSAHASRGCGQADLQGTGGDGLFYCFAAGE